MLASDIFSGRWLKVAGGGGPNSCQIRLVDTGDRSWRLDLMYNFDTDDLVSLSFALTSEEVGTISSEIQAHGYGKLESVKNGYPFIFEIQLRDGNAEVRLDGQSMAWPGHPQRFRMTQFQSIL